MISGRGTDDACSRSCDACCLCVTFVTLERLCFNLQVNPWLGQPEPRETTESIPPSSWWCQ